MMQSLRAFILNRQLRILKDCRSVYRKFCLFSSLRCYGAALSVSPIRSRKLCNIGISTVTHSTSVLSAAQNVQTSCCAVHSDSVIDAALIDGQESSTGQLSGGDCLDVEGSNLHTPVLAKEVVSLIAPVKGQVCVFL